MHDDMPPDRPWKPNLFIVGAPKCGTTSLCHYLGQHPDIFFSKQKEPLFFCTDHVHREPWRQNDPERYLALFEPGADRRWRGEGSVWYLISQAAPRRIRAYSPDAKIIIMLRNPIDMAVSLHAQFLFSGNETIPDFAEAYAAQPIRARQRRVPWRAHMPAGLQYTEIGRYAPQVEHYLEIFPHDKVKVLIFEDFFADLAGSFRDLLEFLEVDPAFAPDFRARNERHELRSIALQRMLTKLPELWELPAGLAESPLQRRIENVRARLHRYNTNGNGKRTFLRPELRSRLHGDFEDDIARLERLLGRDLSVWRTKNLGETTDHRRRPGQKPVAASA